MKWCYHNIVQEFEIAVFVINDASLDLDGRATLRNAVNGVIDHAGIVQTPSFAVHHNRVGSEIGGIQPFKVKSGGNLRRYVGLLCLSGQCRHRAQSGKESVECDFK